MGDGWKQDECRRGLTFDDDVYQTLDPLSREPFTQLYLRPGGHKGKGTRDFVFPYLVPVVGIKDDRE